MKKFKSFLGCSLSLLLLLCPSSTYAAKNVTGRTLDETSKVIYVESLNKQSTIAENQVKQALNDTSNKITYDKINLHGSNLNINALLTIQDKKYNISLEGTLKKIDTSNEIAVGDFKDKNNNFDVINFSIDDKSDKFVYASGSKYDVPTMNIYLKQKNSSNVVFIETDISKNLNLNSIFS